jgi:hypothetical protein
MVGRYLNDDELGSIWKEAVVAQSRYYPNIYSEGLENPRKPLRTTAASAEIHNSRALHVEKSVWLNFVKRRNAETLYKQRT